MTTIALGRVFDASVTTVGRIDSSMVSIMNRSATFQQMFAVAEENDGLAPTPTDSGNIGPADYSAKRAMDEGLGLTQEFFVAKELGLTTFSGGGSLFNQMRTAYTQMDSAGMSSREIAATLKFVARTAGRNDIPSTNENLNAGLTEEERAAKAGLAAGLDTAYAQSHPNDARAGEKRVGHFMPLGIDLDPLTGNTSSVGSVSTLNIAQTEANRTNVSFDWDGTGYQKQTGWIAADDGFLVLDRNFNDSVDNGTELLSNPLVADPAKGLCSLAAFDANADGRIDALDPVYAPLKVWQDLDQDGNNTHSLQMGPFTEVAQDQSNGVKELRSLADWGISAIDYGNSRYEFGSGSGTNSMGYESIFTQTLEAREDGVQYTPVGASIKIQLPDGAPQIEIRQIQSEAAHWTQQSANETWRQAA